MSYTIAETFLDETTVIEINRHDTGTVVVSFGPVKVYAAPFHGWPAARLAAELRRVADELDPQTVEADTTAWCGAVDDDGDDDTWTICQRPAGHPGNHSADLNDGGTVVWPQTEVAA